MLVLAVAVGRSGAQPFPALRLGPLHRPDLPAGVPDEPLVKEVLEGHQLRALTPVGVHIVVDGDVADAKHGEPLLDVQPRVELVAPQSGQVLGDDGADLPVFHICHHLLEAGAVEAAPGIAVIHIKAGVGEAVLPCVPFQDISLRKDLSRVISAERSQIINVKFLQKQGATVFYGNPLLFSNSYRIKFQ